MATLLKKEQAGSAGHNGRTYVWSEDGEVIEVPDEMAAAVLLIPRGGFSVVEEEPEEGEEDSDGEAEQNLLPIPPRVGAGSSAKDWATYAAANDVEVAENAKRDEIIAACNAAGVATATSGS